MLLEQLSPISFFEELNKETMYLVDEFYDKNAVFKDPIVELSSSKEIKNYYANMYKNVEQIGFTFQDEIKAGDKTTLVWRMSLVAKSFNGGNPVFVDGVSVIKFGGSEGKAVYHRDYFDMGAFVYEGLPLIGGIIRFAKRKMAQHKDGNHEKI